MSTDLNEHDQQEDGVRGIVRPGRVPPDDDGGAYQRQDDEAADGGTDGDSEGDLGGSGTWAAGRKRLEAVDGHLAGSWYTYRVKVWPRARPLWPGWHMQLGS